VQNVSSKLIYLDRAQCFRIAEPKAGAVEIKNCNQNAHQDYLLLSKFFSFLD
jgi:hypothetical protein